MKYIIAIILLAIFGFIVYYKFFKNKRRTFIIRPERGKVKDILKRTNKISNEKREELKDMKQDELLHELNKNYKKLFKEKKNESRN